MKHSRFCQLLPVLFLSTVTLLHAEPPPLPKDLAPLQKDLPPLPKDPPTLQSVSIKDIDGKDSSLQAYAGKVLLLVNVASECGNTPQYAGLEAAWRKYQGAGLVVLGFPSNDFGGQEPGTNAEIKKFCTSRYEVTFPMFAKIHVKGPGQHPLYALLTGPSAGFPGDVDWNFGKFLIGRNGKLIARFDADVEPGDAKLVAAIEKALAAKE